MRSSSPPGSLPPPDSHTRIAELAHKTPTRASLDLTELVMATDNRSCPRRRDEGVCPCMKSDDPPRPFPPWPLVMRRSMSMRAKLLPSPRVGVIVGLIAVVGMLFLSQPPLDRVT